MSFITVLTGANTYRYDLNEKLIAMNADVTQIDTIAGTFTIHSDSVLSSSQIANMQTLVDTYGALFVITDRTVLLADTVDSIEISVQNNPQYTYELYEWTSSGYTLIDSGSVDAPDTSLAFTTDTAGSYLFKITALSGGKTGFLEVRADDV